MQEMRKDVGVRDRPGGRIEAEHVLAGLDEEAPGAGGQRQRLVTAERRLLDELVLVDDAVLREELPRAGAGRSAVPVVEHRAFHVL